MTKRLTFGRIAATAALLLSLAFLNPGFGQTFMKMYGDATLNEGGMCMLPDTRNANGDFWVGGYRADSALLIHMDDDGNVLATRTFRFTNPVTATANDQITAMKLDSDNLIYGCGVNGTGAGRIAFAFRYDPVADVVLWSREGLGNSFGMDIVEMRPGGNYIMTGGEMQAGGFSNDGYAVQLNRTTGAVGAFNSQYNLGSAETFGGSVMYDDTTLIVTGRLNSQNCCLGQMRASLAAIHANTGAVLWSRSYLHALTWTARQYSFDVEVDNDSLVMIHAGDNNGTSPTTTTLGLSKHLPNGTLVWAWDYQVNAIGNEWAWSLQVLGDGYLIFATDRAANGDVIVIRTDINGAVLWSNRYGGPGSEVIFFSGDNEMIVYNNSIYFTVQSNSWTGGDQDVMVVRTDLSGLFSPDCPFTDTVGVIDTLYQNPADFAVVLAATASSNTMTAVNSAPVVTDIPDTLICGVTCFADGNPNYEQILVDRLVASDEDWVGKYYIAPGVTVTVDGATLDLTNVDLVFGECAGIDFINQGHVRANNSVFRPCNEDETWRGFSFTGGSDGVVNECTFKNAQRGMAFGSGAAQQDNSTARITNNLFVNCRWGVFVEFDDFADAITGNTFIVDDRMINYAPDSCFISPYNNDHYGIAGTAAGFEAMISQNDFVNASEANAAKELIGFWGLQTRGRLTANNFTNCLEAVEISECEFFSIENNEIEITQDFRQNLNQIRVSGGTWIWITGNHLVNSVEHDKFALTGAAIYADNTRIINIKENTVEGFLNGIQAMSLIQGNIGENKISNSAIYGIYMEDGQEVDIACNQIDMRLQNDITVVGIGYLQYDPSSGGNRIRGNCISNTAWAILTFSAVGGNIPLIVNNYMYNYTTYGVYNDGFSGGIGTGTTFALAGRNTFVSNNIPAGAFDVFSTVPIVAAGNFGISTVNANVTTSGTGLFNSTAACGHQIGTVSQQLTDEEICDNFTDDMDGSFRLALDGKIKEVFGDMTPKYRQPFATSLLARMHSDGLTTDAEAFHQAMLQSAYFDATDKSLFTYAHRLAQGDYAAATQVLGQLDGTSAADFAAVEQVRLALLTSGRPHHAMTPAELATLADIAEDWTLAGDYARDLLHLQAAYELFRFRPVFLPEAKKGESPINLEAGLLEVFPNPGTDFVNVRYNVLNLDGAQLELLDVAGRRILRQPLKFNSGQMQIDIQNLEQGIYLLSLSNADGRQEYKKLVKF